MATLSVAELFGAGVEHHHAARLAEAEACYRRVLAAQPNHADALHLLGVIAGQTRRYELAVELIDQAIQINPDVAAAFHVRGYALHELNRFDEALASYDRAVALKPDDAKAFFNRGRALRQLKRLDEALASYDKAVALKPDYAEAFFNRGNALQELRRLDEALASYDKAVALKPDYAEAFNNRGYALYEIKCFDEALASYDKAIMLKPNIAAAFCNRGRVLQELARLVEALASYNRAVALKPDYAEAFLYRGNALQQLNRLDEAVASYDRVLALKPDHAVTLNNRGAVLQELRRLDEALASYDKALALNPCYAEALNNRGSALNELGRIDEALASYDKAIALKPDLAEAYKNRGGALNEARRIDEAVASYRKALSLRQNYPEAHSDLGYALLLAGRFEEGWKEQEWRWKTPQMSGEDRHFPVPLWHGEAIRDRVILLHAEQGLGDTLQFCRYVPLVAAGAKAVLEVQAPLVRLLSRLPGIMAIVARGDRLPSFDLHCPLLSLPHALGTTLDTIPGTTPYLAAEPSRAADWRRRLAGLDGLKVGLVWAGGQREKWQHMAIDRRRSIALDTMAPFGEVPGVSFISLQKGGPAAQAATPPHGMTLHDFTAELHDFDDTAALIDGLDLVISVDTAVAHLAGALGKPVWLLNRFDSCWRWLLNRDDSPWYPLLRQFRQPSPGDWTSVIRGARDALQRLAAGDRDQLRPRFGGMGSAGAGSPRMSSD